MLVALTAVAVALVANAPAYLAVTEPARGADGNGARVLIVEGWMDDRELDQRSVRLACEVDVEADVLGHVRRPLVVPVRESLGPAHARSGATWSGASRLLRAQSANAAASSSFTGVA